jgi:hypothetical protein
MSPQAPGTGKPDNFDEALKIGRPPNIVSEFQGFDCQRQIY